MLTRCSVQSSSSYTILFQLHNPLPVLLFLIQSSSSPFASAPPVFQASSSPPPILLRSSSNPGILLESSSHHPPILHQSSYNSAPILLQSSSSPPAPLPHPILLQSSSTPPPVLQKDRVGMNMYREVESFVLFCFSWITSTHHRNSYLSGRKSRPADCAWSHEGHVLWTAA